MDPGAFAASAAAEKRLEEFLWDYSNKIIPTDEYTSGGKMAVDKVFKLLKRESRFSLDRSYISGSVGKKTAVIFSDFDCIIFVNPVNGAFPVLSDVLDDFERILTNEMLKVEKFKKTRFSVQFSFHGYEIDLLPATNFAPHVPNQNMDVLASEQAYQVLRRLEKQPFKWYEYSSSLCESNLKFIRHQSDFVHRFARLAKFWNRSLYTEEYISGRSSTVELIGIYAAIKEKKARGVEKPSMVNTLRNFLGMIQNIRNLRIEFPDFNPLLDLQSYPECRGMKFGGGSGCVDPPYVMEPSNPYNNMLMNFSDKARALFEEFATATLEAMDTLLHLGAAPVPFRLPSALFCVMSQMLFAKYPVVLPMSRDFRQTLGSRSCFIAGVRNYDEEETKVPTIKFNKNEDKYKTSGMRALLRGIQEYLETAVATAETKEEAKKAVQSAISVKIKGQGEQEWNPTDNKFTDCDVNFIIPCPPIAGEEQSWVKVGFSFP